MSEKIKSRSPRVSLTALEEAGIWLALLHATDRKEDIPRGFRRWLALSAENEAAFEVVTEGWELSHLLTKQPLTLPRKWQRAGFRAGFTRAITAVAASSAIALVGIVWHLRQSGISTDIGEQRIVTLEDGTRVVLNTDTRLLVRYDDEQRLVELKKGEALFEVAQHRDRPFAVIAADRRVTALGTSFIVRHDRQRLSVTLVEGKVTVAPREVVFADEAEAKMQTLLPGERITFTEKRPPTLDRPEAATIAAWRKGQVEMDGLPLSEAIAEMNRYSVIKLVIAGAEAEQAHVNGVFRAGDVTSFADSMASTCGFQVIRKSHEIVLTGTPSPNCRQ